MTNFVLEIFDDEGSKCTFYTVRVEGSEYTETRKFILKFQDDKRLVRSLQELLNMISIQIGEKYGARDYFFRNERTAQALPPKPNVKEITVPAEFALRLYCLRLSESCVILFNGGEKTSASSQSGKTSMTFYEANIFAEQILKAKQEKTIKLSDDQRRIVDYYETEDISNIIL